MRTPRHAQRTASLILLPGTGLVLNPHKSNSRILPTSAASHWEHWIWPFCIRSHFVVPIWVKVTRTMKFMKIPFQILGKICISASGLEKPWCFQPSQSQPMNPDPTLWSAAIPVCQVGDAAMCGGHHCLATRSVVASIVSSEKSLGLHESKWQGDQGECKIQAAFWCVCRCLPTAFGLDPVAIVLDWSKTWCNNVWHIQQTIHLGIYVPVGLNLVEKRGTCMLGWIEGDEFEKVSNHIIIVYRCSMKDMTRGTQPSSSILVAVRNAVTLPSDLNDNRFQITGFMFFQGLVTVKHGPSWAQHSHTTISNKAIQKYSKSLASFMYWGSNPWPVAKDVYERLPPNLVVALQVDIPPWNLLDFWGSFFLCALTLFHLEGSANMVDFFEQTKTSRENVRSQPAKLLNKPWN